MLSNGVLNFTIFCDKYFGLLTTEKTLLEFAVELLFYKIDYLSRSYVRETIPNSHNLYSIFLFMSSILRVSCCNTYKNNKTFTITFCIVFETNLLVQNYLCLLEAHVQFRIVLFVVPSSKEVCKKIYQRG